MNIVHHGGIEGRSLRSLPGYAVLFGGVGAAVGTAGDALFRRKVVVFQWPRAPGRLSPDPAIIVRWQVKRRPGMHVRRLLLGILFVAIAADRAAAQVERFEDLPARLNLGDNVTVVDAVGMRWRGPLVGLTPVEMVVRADGRDVALARPDVAQVGVCCDSLWNGAIIGAIPGFFVGFMGGYEFADRDRIRGGLAIGLIYGGMTAGVGLGVDALIRGDRIIYRARRATISIRVDPASGILGARMAWGR